MLPPGFIALPEAVLRVVVTMPPPKGSIADTILGPIGIGGPEDLRFPDTTSEEDRAHARAIRLFELAKVEAQPRLLKAFADEHLTAFWFLPTGETLPIPPAAWRGHVLTTVWDGEPLAWQPMDRSQPKLWGWVMVREVALGAWLMPQPVGTLPARPTPSPSKIRAAPKARHGGNRPSRAVERVKGELGAKLSAEGVPEQGDGGQAILERWFVERLAAAGASLSESRVRKHVRSVMIAHRAVLTDPG
ncbi:MAG: hypothetical protein K2X74_13975 [Acetobacteraceae bacterium]|nr:hypothetical protein [Acetobacteraceae bacterium]